MSWRRCGCATARLSAPPADRAAKPASSTGFMSASSTRAAISTPARSIPENACRNGCRRSDSLSPRAGRGGLSPGRLNDGAALTEADAHGAVFGAVAAEDDFVAVLDEAALLAARQFERLAAARREFEQAAPARFLRTRNCAGTEQVA